MKCTRKSHCLWFASRHSLCSLPFWSEQGCTEPTVPHAWKRMRFGSNWSVIWIFWMLIGQWQYGYVPTAPKGNFVFTSAVDCWPWPVAGYPMDARPWRTCVPYLLSQLRCCLLLPTPHADMAQLIWLMLTAFWGCLVSLWYSLSSRSSRVSLMRDCRRKCKSMIQSMMIYIRMTFDVPTVSSQHDIWMILRNFAQALSWGCLSVWWNTSTISTSINYSCKVFIGFHDHQLCAMA